MFLRIKESSASIVLIASLAGCSSSGGTTTAPIVTPPAPPVVSSTTVTADFSTWIDNPLVKDKIGVYQTPFMGTVGIAPPTTMQPFLVEAGVRDLRYETAWGKPDAYVYNQIGGTAAAPVVDFSQLDSFITMLQQNHVQPLLAVGYDPIPLQTCPVGVANCWQSPPSNYAGWQSVLSQVSSHYSSALGFSGVQYEMWNEPDLILGASKTFFSGNQTDYASVYKYGVAGVKSATANSAGVANALVGGPAIAYDTTYITQSGLLQQPFDFLSIHAYANYSSQIGALRSVATGNGPLYLTEYGSFTTQGATLSNSTHTGAMQFFPDINQMLADSDVAKVYWAQWIDDSLGMITYSLHRKAIFNAYKIYQTMLPVDRVTTTLSNTSAGLGSMAAQDAHTAGMVVWNSSITAQPVTVQMNNLPFANGKLTQWYVDQSHASYADNATENLTAGGDNTANVTGGAATWTGTIQPQSLIYIHVTDGSASLLTANSIGTYAGDHFYFSARPTSAYADFDPATSIARLGMGGSPTGAAIVGNTYDVAAGSKTLNVSLTKAGTFSTNSVNSVFGVRVDFQSTSGAFTKSILYTDGTLYNSQRTQAITWGTGRAVPDQVRTYSGASFQMNLKGDGPTDWDGKRIIITPLLVDAGAGAKARLQFSLVP